MDEPQTEAAKETGEQPRKRGGMHPGQTRGVDGKILAAPSPPGPEGPGTAMEEGLLPHLAGMRWVLERKAVEDKTELQKACRKHLRSDVKGFMAGKQKLEEAWAARNVSKAEGKQAVEAALVPSPEKAEPDQGTARAEELIERLLGEWDNVI